MYRLPDGRTIRRPEQVEINNIIYPKTIFTSWSRTKLYNIGIKEVIEERYNREHYYVTSWNEEEIDMVIYRTPTLQVKTSTNVRFEKHGKYSYELPTCDMEIVDSGIDASTEEIWIKVRVGGISAYLRGYTTK